MNYLAHFYLSFDQPDVLIGQFLGDFVKGSRYKDYPDKIQQGILLHRFVDSTTDSSELTNPIRDLLRPYLGRYAGIALDIYFDHFLAVNWNTFHKHPLEVFIQWAYQELSSESPLLNEEMKTILVYMKKFDWLGRYSEISGIEKTLLEMSRRMPINNTLITAPTVFRDMYPDIEKAFFGFFPQLVADSRNKLDTFATNS